MGVLIPFFQVALHLSTFLEGTAALINSQTRPLHAKGENGTRRKGSSSPTAPPLGRCLSRGDERGHEHAKRRVGLKAIWKREFKLPWREAGPPNNHDDKVDSDQ